MPDYTPEQVRTRRSELLARGELTPERAEVLDRIERRVTVAEPQIPTPAPKTWTQRLFDAVGRPDDPYVAARREQIGRLTDKIPARVGALEGDLAVEESRAAESDRPSQSEDVARLQAKLPQVEDPGAARKRAKERFWSDLRTAVDSGAIRREDAEKYQTAYQQEFAEPSALMETTQHVLGSGTRAAGTAVTEAAYGVMRKLRQQHPEWSEDQIKREVVRATSTPQGVLQHPKEFLAAMWEGVKAFPPTEATKKYPSGYSEAAFQLINELATTKNPKTGEPQIETPYLGNFGPKAMARFGLAADLLADPAMYVMPPIVKGIGKGVPALGKALAATRAGQAAGRVVEGSAPQRLAHEAGEFFLGTPSFARHVEAATKRHGIAGAPTAEQLTWDVRRLQPSQMMLLGDVKKAIPTLEGGQVAHEAVEAAVGKALTSPEQLQTAFAQLGPKGRAAADALMALAEQQGKPLHELAKVPLREAYLPMAAAEQPSKLKWWERALGKQPPEAPQIPGTSGGMRLGGHVKERTLPQMLTKEATPAELRRVDELKARLDAVKKAQERYLAERTMRRVESRAEEEFYGNPWPDIPIEEALRGGAGQIRGATGAKVIGPQGSASPVAPPPLTKEMLEAWTPGRPPRVAPGEVTSASYATTPGTQKFRTEISPRLAMAKATEREIFPAVDPLKAELSPGATPLGTVYREAMQKSPMARYERLLAKATQAAEGKVRPPAIETATEANKYLAETGWKTPLGQKLGPGWKYEEDLAKVAAQRYTAGALEIPWMRFMDRNIKPMVRGMPEGEKVPKGWMRVSDLRGTLPSRVLGRDLKKGETALIPEEAGRLLKHMAGRVPTSMVGRLLDGLSRLWARGMTVTAGPAYLIRNAETSALMMERYNPMIALRGLEDVPGIMGSGRGQVAGVPFEQIRTELMRLGQHVGTGRTPAVLANEIKASVGGKVPWSAPLIGERGALTKLGGGIATGTDEAARAWAVANELRSGATLDQAVKRAYKLIVHTQDLSPAGQLVKKVAPFAPWSGRQLPNVIKQGASGRLGAITKLQNYAEATTPEELKAEPLPKRAQEMSAMPVGAKGEMGWPMYLSMSSSPAQTLRLLEPLYELALGDPAKFGPALMEQIQSQGLPWLTGPLQSVAGTEAWSGQELDLPKKARPASQAIGQLWKKLTGKPPKWVYPVGEGQTERWVEEGDWPLVTKAIPWQPWMALGQAKTPEEFMLRLGRVGGKSVFPVLSELDRLKLLREIEEAAKRAKLKREMTTPK